MMAGHVQSCFETIRSAERAMLVGLLERGPAAYGRSSTMIGHDESSPHIPVLGGPVIDWLSPRADGVYIDATFGAGGYTRAILNVSGTRVIAIDRDRTAIEAGAALAGQFAGRVTLIEDRFSNLDDICADRGFDFVDGIVMDVGVSSMQLDRAERGFSFRFDGPLDMRMGQDGPSAADLIAKITATDLARILAVLGEEKFARPIARAIVTARNEAPVTTTKALVGIIGKVLRQRPGEIHPATRTFQALRIFINEELDELRNALTAAERVLKPGGRLAVVSFHSLEDRIVKTFMTDRARVGGGSRHQPEVQQAAPSFTILTKRPVVADENELQANLRARSAKLRVAERTGETAHAAELAADRLPSLDDVMKGR